jgi:hypothetical protein
MAYLLSMEDTKRPPKTTSITLPADWWDTLTELSSLRKIQGGKENQSFNSIAVEVMGAGIEDARLELLERRGRRVSQ